MPTDSIIPCESCFEDVRLTNPLPGSDAEADHQYRLAQAAHLLHELRDMGIVTRVDTDGPPAYEAGRPDSRDS